ncbi:MAG: molybdenum cofactor biosynthesis protein, partial [Pseudomonadota bacterium]|nr:molybdenum cofactor biosynthesis protein [Pseudomonadota bacterium]
MHGINESLPFHPVRIAILVMSDTRTLDNDTSGALLADRIEKAGHIV